MLVLVLCVLAAVLCVAVVVVEAADPDLTSYLDVLGDLPELD